MAVANGFHNYAYGNLITDRETLRMNEQRESQRTGNGCSSLRETLENAESLVELQGTYDGTYSRSERLSDDEIFEVLYNGRRRKILTYLLDHDGVSTAGEVAEHIAAIENDTTVQGLSSYERKRVYVGLYQNHLPMMDDIGIVEYDKNRGTVQLCECSKQLEPYLDSTDESNESRIIAGCALAFAGLPLLSALEVGSVGGFGDPLWIVIGAIGFFALTLLDTYGSLG